MIDRYQTQRMKSLWSEENKFRRWLDVEIAATQAWVEAGKVPPEALAEIRERARFSVERINEIESVTHHDVIAFVSCVAENVGEAGRFVHYGLTSSDVVDTAGALLLTESIDVLLESLDELAGQTWELAWKYRYTPCAGRTHGVHAEPTTFGLKILNAYAEFQRDKKRLAQAREDVAVGKLSGAVGTYANCPPEIERRVCDLLGLSVDPVSTQIVQRDRHAHVMTSLALYGGALERLALEVRHLQRTEVREALEPFGKGQKGSSAMPHKKNPILCERVCGMARLLRAYASAALENIALWHERDISHSSVERVIWPDAFGLAHYTTGVMTRVVRGLQVDEERMRENFDLTKGLLFSGRVLVELVEREGCSREEAYAIAQENAMRCWETKEPLLDLLAKDARIKKMSREELASLFDVGYYLRYIDTIFSRFSQK